MKTKLISYRKKRDFTQTPEPYGEPMKRTKPLTNKAPIFVVQKHDATRLHYDVRLEIGNVLVSWAVPKGPPRRAGIKRLAIQTEDHPMEYATFEGTIPEGQYGAGTVEVWDTGTFYNIKQKDGKTVPLKTCLKDGQIEVYLEGTKLKGPYALVKTSFGKKDNQWLMLKMKAKK